MKEIERLYLMTPLSAEGTAIKFFPSPRFETTVQFDGLIFWITLKGRTFGVPLSNVGYFELKKTIDSAPRSKKVRAKKTTTKVAKH